MVEIDETLLAVACFVLSGRVARIAKREYSFDNICHFINSGNGHF